MVDRIGIAAIVTALIACSGEAPVDGADTELLDTEIGGDIADASQDLDVAERLPDADVEVQPDAPPPPPKPWVRAPCFEGDPIETGIEPAPDTCVALFEAQPERASGCYVLADGLGGTTPGYCWHRKLLILLVNNETESGFHPDDTDQDGVIDQGDFSGTNWPADPFEGPEALSERLHAEIRDWFADVSYGSLYMNAAQIYWEPSTDGEPSRWFRLLQERPGFANPGLFDRVCALAGGMTAEQWETYDSVVTLISHGTQISGSQGRIEAVPVGQDCGERQEIWRNYVVMKNFRGFNRLGTFFHEITHGLARDPDREPSIGHSESINADSGDAVEYGDLTDVMGESGTRGHLSLPQKLFLRFLPEDAVDRVAPGVETYTGRIHPLESRFDETKGVVLPVMQGRDYYLETRRSLGNDARLATIFHSGVLVKRARQLELANKSWIVDPTPETPSDRSVDNVLLPHRTFVDVDNALAITVLENTPNHADVFVHFGPLSALSPSVLDVEVLEGDGSTTYTAAAVPGEVDIPVEELSFFWKMGAEGGLTVPEGFRTGVTVSWSDEDLPRELWLVVSDRRGGETWHRVLP